MANFTVLCQLKDGCMGCCGRDFISKEKIKEAIEKNTAEFESINPQVKAQLMKFRDRAHPDDLLYGVCRNLIEREGRFICPLHPKLNQGIDLRKNHCDFNYFCRTAREFMKWNSKKKLQFVEFVCGKGLDNLNYSILMEKGNLLEEFGGNVFRSKRNIN